MPGCGKKYQQQSQFTYHMNRHNNVRPYLCRNVGCAEAFFDPSSRTYHQNRCEKKSNNEATENTMMTDES